VADFLPPVKRFLGKLLKKVPTGKVEPIAGKKVVWFKDVLRDHPAEKLNIDLSGDDICLLQYTGGTTGPSKGTILTHANLIANTFQYAQWFDEDSNAKSRIEEVELGKEVVCSGFPFFHQAGLAIGMLNMGFATTQILVPDPRNTDNICRDLRKYRPTVLVNVPTLYQMLLENPMFKTIDFSGCKYCLSGAAPFGVDSILALEKVVGEGKVIEVYGMTETSPLITMNPLKGRKKIGSVGIPIQNTRVKIVDVETGTKEIPLGEPGEIIVNGPQVMKGYHNKPEATAKTKKEFQNETWMYTGDIAKMDEDGFIYIVDRAKDMLLVGGFNVYSKEVEETLYEIPDVEFCAIVGLPNPEREGSEIVKAVIQLATNSRQKDKPALEKAITAYCRENMAPYKVPKIIEFVDEIPLTSVGKVDKKSLR
jgi:acyl-CoA synthetase (AMP-forming)/AMP-acid ligase II